MEFSGTVAAPSRGHGQEAAADAATGVLAGTEILTLSGAMPVEYLSPGDRIITREGARVLRALRVRHAGRLPLVRIAAGALGHDRPEAGLDLPADQPVLLRDWRARVMFGTDRAVLPVRRLIDGEFVRPVAGRDLRVFTLAFDAPQVVYAEGMELPCPAVGATADEARPDAAPA